MIDVEDPKEKVEMQVNKNKKGDYLNNLIEYA